MRDGQGELTAALLEAAAESARGENPEALLRRLGDKIRALGMARKPEPARLTSGAAGMVVAPPAGVQTTTSSIPTVLVPEVNVAAVKRQVTREAVIEVFLHWQVRMGYEQARLTSDRATKIQARFRDGYTIDDLKRAIDGCASSPFHSGENERSQRYDDISLIMRNGSNVERFRELVGEASITEAAQPKKKTVEEYDRETKLRALKKEAKQLLKEGKTEEYANAIRSIRDLG